jgi:hypothetical protein
VTLPFVLLLLDWWPLGRLQALGAGRSALGGTGLHAFKPSRLQAFTPQAS